MVGTEPGPHEYEMGADSLSHCSANNQGDRGSRVHVSKKDRIQHEIYLKQIRRATNQRNKNAHENKESRYSENK